MSSVKQIFEETIQTDHKVITEEAAKSILKKYAIKVPGFALVKSTEEAAKAATTRTTNSTTPTTTIPATSSQEQKKNEQQKEE